MKTNASLVKCCQCGYEFRLSGNLRCPRCFTPVVKLGGCSGSCGSCSAGIKKGDKNGGGK